ncbi:hypothetical protein [Actinomadura kijaniata]
MEGADLRGADLRGVVGVDADQIRRVARVNFSTRFGPIGVPG